MIAQKKKEELLTGGILCGRKEPKPFFISVKVRQN